MFHLDVLERVSFIGLGISSILNSRGIYCPEEVKVSVDFVFQPGEVDGAVEDENASIVVLGVEAVVDVL